MDGYTVLDLKNELDWLVEKGYGNRRILLSRDEEWNGFHEMYYGTMEDVEEIRFHYDCDDAKNVILIG